MVSWIFFPPAFVNSQIAQVNRPKFLERMVSGSSPLCSQLLFLPFFFFFKLRTLKIEREKEKRVRGSLGKVRTKADHGTSWRQGTNP